MTRAASETGEAAACGKVRSMTSGLPFEAVVYTDAAVLGRLRPPFVTGPHPNVGFGRCRNAVPAARPAPQPGGPPLPSHEPTPAARKPTRLRDGRRRSGRH